MTITIIRIEYTLPVQLCKQYNDHYGEKHKQWHEKQSKFVCYVFAEKEKLLTYPKMIAQYIGGHVRIHCNIEDGDWTKNNEALPPFFEVQENGDLVLMDVDPERTGNYICRSHSDSSIEGTTSVYVGG